VGKLPEVPDNAPIKTHSTMQNNTDVFSVVPWTGLVMTVCWAPCSAGTLRHTPTTHHPPPTTHHPPPSQVNQKTQNSVNIKAPVIRCTKKNATLAKTRRFPIYILTCRPGLQPCRSFADGLLTTSVSCQLDTLTLYSNSNSIKLYNSSPFCGKDSWNTRQ